MHACACARASALQVLVYFAVAKLGDAPLDGVTDVNPEGLTAATGKWAPAVAARLHSAGLSCKVRGNWARRGGWGETGEGGQWAVLRGLRNTLL